MVLASVCPQTQFRISSIHCLSNPTDEHSKSNTTGLRPAIKMHPSYARHNVKRANLDTIVTSFTKR